MPFGLTNVPAIMQRLIDRVLADHKKYALAYMDDIIIFSSDFESHLLMLLLYSKPLATTSLPSNRANAASPNVRCVS